MPYTVLYFDSRGRAEPVRLALALAGQPFDERHVTRDNWLEVKPTTPLGQVPVLFDGDRAIPQTSAILRLIGRRHGLYGRTEEDALACDVAYDTVVDLRTPLSTLRFTPGWQDPAVRAKFVAETASAGLARVAKVLGDHAFIAGDAPTWADAYAYDTLDGFLGYWPDVLDAWPTLKAYHARVRALPQLQAYLAVQRPGDRLPA